MSALSRRFRDAALGAVAHRLGMEAALPYLSALEALALDPDVAYPRELAPLLARVVGQGLLAAQVFQLGADWVWPYWVCRQLDPLDAAYLPRGMSPLWLNLTHRNWTAIGVPGGFYEAVVDPRGLLTPRLRGWSVDAVVRVGGVLYAPSRLVEGYAVEADAEVPWVRGRWRAGPLVVETGAWAESVDGVEVAVLRIAVWAEADAPDCEILVSIRPFNPEGPSLVRAVSAEGPVARVEGQPAIVCGRDPAAWRLSTWREGDALVASVPPRAAVSCPVGFATAAASFPTPLARGGHTAVLVAAPIDPAHATEAAASVLAGALGERAGPSSSVRGTWRRAVAEGAILRFDDAELQRTFDRARLALLLLDDGDAVRPGPLTYHQHWFRDSAYLVTALARLGYRDRAREKLVDYPARQDRDGFFRSQDGEWDSNGQAIWTVVAFSRLYADVALLASQRDAILRGARWIVRKRATPGGAGLLPPGLSAEHLGPHDRYFWDDLWGIAGLRAAAHAMASLGLSEDASRLREEAAAFLLDVDAALRHAAVRLGRPAMPAAPDRPLDAGMIGNVAACWPLDLMPADDPRLTDTLAALEARYFLQDAFLHPLVHSGWNPYLTLQCAQCYLAAGRARDAWRLFHRVRALATADGSWPEAIHPRTGGGCMGDGFHGWAAAEFVLFLRNTVAIERDDTLIVTPIGFEAGLEVERLPTCFGEVDLRISVADGRWRLRFQARFREAPIAVRWAAPGGPVDVPMQGGEVDGGAAT